MNRNPPIIIKHGEMVGGRSPEYVAWVMMKGRCTNPRHPHFASYGGRGITVCLEWANDVAVFIAHVGRRPSPAHSLDRIDNDRGYEPGNVRWSTATEQNRNRRKGTRSGKLTAVDIPWIKHWIARGYRRTCVARSFAISPTMVTRILNGKAWKP